MGSQKKIELGTNAAIDEKHGKLHIDSEGASALIENIKIPTRGTLYHGLFAFSLDSEVR